MKTFGRLLAVGLLLAGAARAEVPDVAVDIPPVHALTARVMQGLGEPALVMRPGASPHGYAMRPSEAAALERAEVIFFVSGQLTRWFERALEPLAARAVTVELLESPGTVRHAFREDALFSRPGGADEDDEHGHGHGNGDENHGGDHTQPGPDPHGWLDPENGKLWLAHIAETLAGVDPDNAAIYRTNAAAGQVEIDAAVARARALLEPVKTQPFFVHHDAYQYFERRFDLRTAGAVARSDAAQPGPRRVADLRAAVSGTGTVCIFSEPQFNPGLLATVFEGHALRKAALDPLGTSLPQGPGLYPALIETLATDIAACLGGD
ncbi:zinc ABC transporter substrate-binding protein [Marimonas arenosa]|uniref:High-affinity zinc uptake system protein ZnuA n=1 Tax=Marimonas arenosa TaxID=1795305 RepID=A0AAE3WD37_9RHOB|nr:zinc ABC transporter substrate-binding protein [Marimonas arenosa]MDQ2090255.1 zinc ABC transporter substrate-binding protein [Marimonas arenosa]